MLFKGLVVFLFLVIIRPQDFVPGLSGAPLVFVVMGPLLVLWFILPVRKQLFVTGQDKYFSLFFSMMIISTISTGWMSYFVDTGIETLKLALIYFFIVTIASSDEDIVKITKYLIYFMAIVACMGILQYFGYDITGSEMLWAPGKEVWQIRGIGLFDNPNDLAYSVLLIVPIALGLVIESRSSLNRITWMCLLAVSMYCIFLTNSRGGYLAFVFCLAVWFYFWVKNNVYRRITLMAGVMIVLYAFTVQTSGYREDRSAMGRVEAWGAGVDMIKKHPLIGVGKDQFKEFHMRDSHSSYVRAGAELGLIGLFAFIGIIYSSISSLYRVYRIESNVKMRAYYCGFMSFIGSYSVASIFSTRTYDVIFMIVVALTSSMNRSIMFTAGNETFSKQYKNQSIFNRNVFMLTIITLIVWKLFLSQVW